MVWGGIAVWFGSTESSFRRENHRLGSGPEPPRSDCGGFLEFRPGVTVNSE